ncbi:MAG: dimethylsulfonioproprionate lyase family protein [Pseudomonadota bacterium]
MSAFDLLLDALRDAHANHPKLAEFVAFPDDLTPLEMEPRHLPCADYVYNDALFAAAQMPLAQAFLQAGPDAFWRDTYAQTDIGEDFLNRFGCYCAIGAGSPWKSEKMSGFVTMMPPGLYYTWHHHPAEELYVVLAGEAEFYREGEPPETLREGDTSFHASNQPHAMETKDSSVMCYVTWRNHLGIKPVLTERQVTLG